MRRIISTLLLSSFAILTTECQTLRGVLLSEVDRSPVKEAFVFISNSNYAVESNENGFFEIEIGGLTKVSLTISQINYELAILETDPTLHDMVEILMTPKKNEIDEVKFTEKYNPRLRQKRLKRFTEALLGREYDKKNVKITNPEVILLYEKDDKLRVQTQEPLIIENRELGYNINFYLAHFEMHPNNDIYYNGAAFFEELVMDKKQKAKAHRNRRMTYRKSKRHFMSSLFFEKGLDEYRFFVQAEESKKQDYRHITIDSLNAKIISTMKSRTKQIDLATELKVYDVKYSTYSYIKPRNGYLQIDRYGNILNSGEVEESGYWTESRVAALLPYDYTPPN